MESKTTKTQCVGAPLAHVIDASPHFHPDEVDGNKFVEVAAPDIYNIIGFGLRPVPSG